MANDVNKVWFVYLLECQNGRLYTGITPDLELRFNKHYTGKGAMFTRLNKPLRVIAAKPCDSRSEASRLEIQIKKLIPWQKRYMASRWPIQEGLPNVTVPGDAPTTSQFTKEQSQARPEQALSEIEELVVMVRLHLYNREIPCGAKAVRGHIASHYPAVKLPSETTISGILRQQGLTKKRTGIYEED